MKEIDPTNMRNMVMHFPRLLEVHRTTSEMQETLEEFRDQGLGGLCFIGMGGSAIAGNYIQAILSEYSDVPTIVQRNYYIPKYVTESWIVVAISYSGNTEETLDSLKTALRRSIRNICITSDGILKSICNGLLVNLPKGIQPRAAFPLIFAPALAISEILTGQKCTDLSDICRNLENKVKLWGKSCSRPVEIAADMKDKIPLFIASQHLIPVAYRAKCQINENSKQPAFYSEIPEGNHNEIEGFQSQQKDVILPIFLRSEFEHPRIGIRMDATYDLYSELGLTPLELKSGGKSIIEEMLVLTQYLDTISVELAEIKGVNPVSVDRITQLKHQIAKKD